MGPVGVVLVSHGRSSVEMLATACQMVGDLRAVVAVPTEFREEVSAIHARVEQAILAVEQGAGVLLIVDLCGSTPSNVCVGLARRITSHQLDVLYGLSLPMLAKLATADRTQGPSALGQELRDSAKKNIRLTSEQVTRAETK